jgi:CheY-like chemotaxis protein
MVEHGRILVVDDDLAARSKIKSVLAPHYYTTDEASDGVEGLQKVSTFHPDLILLDIVMPRMDGLKMFHYLKHNYRTQDIPVIILTSNTRSVCTFECLQLGANDYITKPFDDYDLLARVERQLEIKEKLDFLMHEKEELASIQSLVQTLYEKKSMYDLLYTLVMKIAEIIQVERCSFVRVKENRKTGVVEASSDSPQVRGFEINLKKYPEIVNVLNTRKTLIVEDMGEDEVMAPVREHLVKIPFQSLVLMPVIENDKTIGTLLLRTARPKKSFSYKEIRFLEAVVLASRPAILNAQLFEIMEEKILNTSIEDGFPSDNTQQFNTPLQDRAQAMMEKCYMLKEEVRRLKGLQQEIRDQQHPVHSRKSRV